MKALIYVQHLLGIGNHLESLRGAGADYAPNLGDLLVECLVLERPQLPDDVRRNVSDREEMTCLST